MAEDKTKSGTGQTSGASGRRPYATLDLKATEIKVTSISDKLQATARSAAAVAAQAADAYTEAAQVPLPAPASAYAVCGDRPAAQFTEDKTMGSSARQAGAEATARASAPQTAEQRTASAQPVVQVRRRGGFFSHLAAGLVGGALAFAGIVWLLPRLGLQQSAFMPASDTSELSQRLTALERTTARPSETLDGADIEKRLAAVEAATQSIPAVTESQKRLVAETKAALASSASDNGSSDLLLRLGKVEDRMKALADAGASDPNAGRVEQLAALTGKVSDLETSLGTQLTELRRSVAQDVEGRVQAATQASEAARAGTQRLDREIAAIKSDAAQLQDGIKSAQEAVEKATAEAKAAHEATAQSNTDIEALKSAAAKPADIAAAVAPLSNRIATAEKTLQDIEKAEAARKARAENVVLSLELQNLKRALEGGQPYGGELAEVQKTAGSKLDLSALAKLQNSGVPSRAELLRAFDATANAAISADSETGDDSVIDRLWEGAKSVVKVRRIDASPDDKSAEATIGRMQVALNEGRLDDVARESKNLSPKAQAAARPFLDKLEARVSIDKALTDVDKILKASMAESKPAIKP